MLQMKKKVIACFITTSMFVSALPAQLVFADQQGDFDPQSLLEQDFHDYSVEPALDELVQDTQPVEFPANREADILQIPDQIDYGAKLQFLGGLIRGQRAMADTMAEYYGQRYDESIPSTSHLESYFTDTTMERLSTENEVMQQLLLCLLDDAAEEPIKDDLKELIENGASIQTAARAYLRYENYHETVGIEAEEEVEEPEPPILNPEEPQTELVPVEEPVEADSISAMEDVEMLPAEPIEANEEEKTDSENLPEETANTGQSDLDISEAAIPSAKESEIPAIENIQPTESEPTGVPQPEVLPEITVPIPEFPPEQSQEPVPSPTPSASLEDNLLVPYLSNIQAMSSSSSTSGFGLYAQQKYEGDQYKQKIDGNVSISDQNGSLSYNYPLLSVPGKNNSSMDLTLNYNVLDAEVFFTMYTDTSDGWGDYKWNITKIPAVSSGWSFNLTHIDTGNGGFSWGNYLILADGRSINTQPSHEENEYPYNDVTYENNCVTYLDGTKEYLNSDGYVQYRDDKYGNRITYTYATEAGYEPKLTGISDNMGHEVKIAYTAAYVKITRPDGSNILLYKTAVAPSTEQISHMNGNVEAEVLNRIYDVDTDTELASFTYEAVDSQCFIGSTGNYGNYIHEDDYITHMAMTSCKSPYSGSRQFTYITPGAGNMVPNGRQSSNLAVETCKQDNQLYLSYRYPPATTENWSMTGTTTLTPDNKVTETIYPGGAVQLESGASRAQRIYRRDGATDYLKQETEAYYGYISEGKYTDAYRPYKVTQKTYNDNGNYIETKTEMEYNNNGQVLLQTLTVEGRVKQVTENTYAADAYSSLTQSTVKNGSGTDLATTSYTVNSFGDLTRQELHEGGITGTLAANTDYFYSGNNLVRKEIKNGSSLLEREYYTYYNNAYLTRVYSTNASGTVIASKYYEYDTNSGRIVRTYDTNTDERVIYDSLGQIHFETHKDGTKKEINYYPRDKYIEIMNEREYNVAYYYHGVQGNLSMVEDYSAGKGYTTLQTLDYDYAGRPVTVKDALNNTTAISYDILGRQTEVLSPQIGTTTASPLRAKYYDVFLEGSAKYAMAMKITQTGNISCEYYDVYGRLAKTAVVKNPSVLTSLNNLDSIYQMPSNVQLHVTKSYTYNDLDRVTCETDGEGHQTKYTYDVLGNVLTMEKGTGAEKSTVSYTYNKAGKLVRTVQGTHVTTYEYDYAGRLIKTTDPVGYTESYTYDTAGNVKTATDKNGVVTTNIYNERGLISSVEKGSQLTQYLYDAAGNLKASNNETGTIQYTYNTDGTLASKQYSDGKKINYTSYNKNKQLTGMTDYLGNTTTYTYTGGSYIQSVSQKMSGSSTANTAKYTYYADGSLKKMDYPNGMMTEYAYNYAGQITTLTNKLASSLSQNSYNYTYDLAGNIKTKKEMNMAETNTRTYTYDSQNRLTYEGSSSGGDFWYYTYDQYNNLTSAIGRGDKYYTYDANNRLTKLQDQWTEKKLPDGNSVWADWTISYAYDKNGTLKSESRIADTNNGIITNAGTKTYTYNDFVQMTGYSDNTGESATYTYYSDGLRASKTTGSDTIRYYYNGQDVINETKNNANYATNIMGVDGFISRTQDGTTGYLFHDAHGDITAAYGTSKNKLADYTYDAWGIQTAANNSAWSQANPIRYNGQYYDTESGMTYLRARYYNSDIQRFITEDPIKDGLN